MQHPPRRRRRPLAALPALLPEALPPVSMAAIPIAIIAFEGDAPPMGGAGPCVAHHDAPSADPTALPTRKCVVASQALLLTCFLLRLLLCTTNDRALGLDTEAPTFVIAEGLLYYLTDSAVASVVETAGKLGGPGSIFICDYFDKRCDCQRRRALASAVES